MDFPYILYNLLLAFKLFLIESEKGRESARARKEGEKERERGRGS